MLRSYMSIQRIQQLFSYFANIPIPLALQVY